MAITGMELDESGAGGCGRRRSQLRQHPAAAEVTRMAQTATPTVRNVQLGLAQVDVEVLVVGVFTGRRRQTQHLI